MVISFVALARVWQRDGVNDDNRLSTSFSELWVYPIPAGLYLIKNLMQARLRRRSSTRPPFPPPPRPLLRPLRRPPSNPIVTPRPA